MFRPTGRFVRSAALAVLAACAPFAVHSARAENWPQYGHDTANSFVTNETWLSSSNVSTLREQWTALAGQSSTCTPCVVGDTAYVSLLIGGIKAVSVIDGHQFWALSLRTTMYGSISYYNGKLFLGDMNCRAYCVNPRTGAILWQASYGDSTIDGFYGAPVIGNDKMYLGVANHTDDNPCSQGRLVAINVANGSVAWTWYAVTQIDGGGGIWNSVAYDDVTQAVFVATGNPCANDFTENGDCIVALNSTTGTMMWKYLAVRKDVMDYDFGSAPTLFMAGTRPGVCAGNKAGYVYACDRTTGQLIWKTQVAQQFLYPFVASAAAYKDRLFVGVGGTGSGPTTPGSIVALKATTGQVLWRHNVKFPVYGSVCVINNLVFTTNGADSLLALDAQTGDQLWGVSLGTALNYSAPCVANGRLFVTGYSMGMKAFGTGSATPSQAATVQPPRELITSAESAPSLRVSLNLPGAIHFRASGGIDPNASIEVYSASGLRVAAVPMVGGEAQWNGTNMRGIRAPRGSYVARLHDGSAATRVLLLWGGR